MKFHVQELRPEVLAFALLMEERLREKDADKGESWKQAFMPNLQVAVVSKTNQLATVRFDHTDANRFLSRHAIDLANYCMMIADVAGALDAEIETLAADQGFGLVIDEDTGNGGPGWEALDQVQMA
jgi:hypothetical protein